MGYSAKFTDVISTSSHFHNCAFHVLTPYICRYIDPKLTETQGFKFIEGQSSSPHRRRFQKTKGFKIFLQAFAGYYDLDQARVVQKRLVELLKAFSNPLDLQVLLGPVLRQTLKELLLEHKLHKAELKESFKNILEFYQQKLTENSNLEAQSLARICRFLKTIQIPKQYEFEELCAPNLDLIAKILGKQITLEEAWEQVYQQYVDFQCDPQNLQYVSESQFAILCHGFGFDFAYTTERKNEEGVYSLIEHRLDSRDSIGTVYAHNPTLKHWQLLAEHSSNWNYNAKEVIKQSAFASYHDFVTQCLQNQASKAQIGILHKKFKSQIHSFLMHGVPYQSQEFDIRTAQKNWYPLKTINSNIDSHLQFVIYHFDDQLCSDQFSTLKNAAGAQKLLKFWQEIYKMPNCSWHDIDESLKSYHHPHDRMLAWYYPVSEYIKNHAHPDAYSRLAREFNIQIQVFDQSVPSKNQNIRTVGLPKSLGQLKQPTLIWPVFQQNGKWHNITDDMQKRDEFNRLMAFGLPFLMPKTAHCIHDSQKIIDREQLCQHKLVKLSQIISNREYNLLAEFLKNNHELSFLNTEVQNVIAECFSKKDWVILLTFAYYNSDWRNIFLKQSEKYANILVLLAKVEKEAHLKIPANQWRATLNEVLPIQYRLEGNSELHEAIRLGLESKACQLILSGSDFYKPNKFGNTPLHLACAFGQVSVIQHMIAQVSEQERNQSFLKRWENTGLKLNLQNQLGQTPLHYAAANLNAIIIKLLLNKNSNPTCYTPNLLLQDYNQRTLLHVAVLHPDKSVFQTVMAAIKKSRVKSAPPNSQYIIIGIKDKLGYTPLHYASLSDNAAYATKILTALKADSNSNAEKELSRQFAELDPKKIQFMATPYSLALETEDCEAIYNLANKNNYKIENSLGNTAALIFAKNNRLDLLQALNKKIKKENILWQKDSQGREPIHVAAQFGCLEVFQAIISHTASKLNTRDKKGYTPLHYASEAGQLVIVKFICELKLKQKNNIQANLNTKNPIKKVIHYSRKKLQAYQPKIQLDQTTNSGETAFMLAAQHPAVKECLQKHGADPRLLYRFILKAIYRSEISNDTSSQEMQNKIQVGLKNVAKAFSKHAEYLVDLSDRSGNNLLHHSVLAHRKKMIKIMLFPLNDAQRLKFCQHKNNEGLSPLALLEERIKICQEDKRIEQLKQIKNIILKYLPQEQTTLSLAEKVELQVSWQQDLRQELLSSTGYSVSSNLMFYTPMAVNTLQTLINTGYWWLAVESMGQYLLGGDLLSNTEKVINTLRPYAPQLAQKPLDYVSRGAYYAGWITQTVNRATTEAIRQGVSFAGTHYLHSQLDTRNNYLDAINSVGFILGVTEGLDKHYFYDKGKSIFGFNGIDCALGHALGYDLSLNSTLMSGLNWTNDAVKQATTLDVQQSVQAAYAYAKENIGQVPSIESVFSSEFADEFKASLLLEDKQELQEATLALAKQVFIKTYDYQNSQIHKARLEILNQFVQTGFVLPETIDTLAVGLVGLEGSGCNSKKIFLDLIENSNFIQNCALTEKQKNEFEQNLTQSINDLEFSAPENVSNALKIVFSEYYSNLITCDIENRFNQEVFANQNLLHNLLESIQNQNQQSYAQRYQDYAALVEFIELGLTEQNHNRLIDCIQQAGLDVPVALAHLYTLSMVYQVFGFDEETTQTYQKLLQNEFELAILDNQSLMEIINTYQSEFINKYIQSQPVHAVGAQFAVHSAYNLSVGQTHPQDMVADTLTEQALNYFTSMHPFATDGEIQIYKETLKQNFLKAQFNNPSKEQTQESLIQEFNLAIDNIETYLVTKWVVESYSQTPDVNEMHYALPEKIVECLKIPKEHQKEVKLLFELAIGRYHADRHQLIETTKQLVSLYASPLHKTEQGMNCIHNMALLALESGYPYFDYSRIVSAGLFALIHAQGGNPNISMEQFAAQLAQNRNMSKDYHPKLHMMQLYENAFEKGPGLLPITPLKLDCENIADLAIAQSHQNGYGTYTVVNQYHPEFFADNPEERATAFQLFCNEERKDKLTEKLEVAFTVYATNDLIQAYTEQSSLNHELQRQLASFQPKYLQASFAVNSLNQSLQHQSHYSGLGEHEKLVLAEKLANLGAVEQIQQELQFTLNQHCLNDEQPLNELCAKIAQDATQFATNQWAGTHERDHRDLNESALPKLSTQDKLKQFGKKILATTGGVQTQVGFDGQLSMGLQYGNLIPITQSKIQNQPLFELNQKPQAANPTTLDLSVAHQIPDYLRYPFGQNNTDFEQQFTLNQQKILNQMLPQAINAQQYAHLLAPYIEPEFIPHKTTSQKSLKQRLEQQMAQQPINPAENYSYTKTWGDRLLDAIFPKAEAAVPLAVGPLIFSESCSLPMLAAVGLGGAGLAYSIKIANLSPEEREIFQKAIGFPIPQTLLEPIMTGQSLDIDRLRDIMSTPIEEQPPLEQVLTTPVPKDETGPSIYTTPGQTKHLPLYLQFKGVPDDDSVIWYEEANQISGHDKLKLDLFVITSNQEIFNPDGTLTQNAIINAKREMDGEKLRIITNDYLSIYGGEKNDWGKYRTQKFYTPLLENNNKSQKNVLGHVHFYKNAKTGDVNYDLDYKVKFKLSGDPWISVDEYFEKLPPTWRFKK